MLTAPTTVEYVPAAQLVQNVRPIPAENFPATHLVQIVAATLAEAVPIGHEMHVASLTAAVAAEYLPGPQPAHVAATPQLHRATFQLLSPVLSFGLQLLKLAWLQVLHAPSLMLPLLHAA